MNRSEYDQHREVWSWMREHSDDRSASQALIATFDLSTKDAIEFWQAYRLIEVANANARIPDELRPIAELAKIELAKLRAKGWTDEEAGLNLCGRCYADIAIADAAMAMGRDAYPGAPREWDILHELMEVQPEDLVKHLPLGLL